MRTVVIVAALLGSALVGCGHSEDEWQAKLRENEELVRQVRSCGGDPSGTAAPAGGNGCRVDTECKGDRVCEDGHCVSPRR
jgi:hypothetical protein